MSPAVMRSLALESASPKYAQIERERRWLVDRGRRPDLSGMPYISIEDRYIIGTRLRLRRMTSNATGDVTLKITKKYEAADPLARALVTTYLTTTEYDLLTTLQARPLEKRRYTVEGYSLDHFARDLAGLELAERECTDDSALRAIEHQAGRPRRSPTTNAIPAARSPPTDSRRPVHVPPADRRGALL